MTNQDEWEEVNASNNETWNREEPLTGTYIGFKTGIGENESTLYNIKTEDGVVGAWGSAVLDNKLSEVEIGSQVKITFKGKVENPKTKRTYNDFSVMVKPAETTKDGLKLADIPFGE